VGYYLQIFSYFKDEKLIWFCLFDYLFVYLFVCFSFDLCFCLFVCLFAYLFLYLFVCLFVFLSFYQTQVSWSDLSVWLSLSV